jgi:3-hydroxyisobutyrate dehydrogenase-like beta-hydroxyacid dehydrogenase
VTCLLIYSIAHQIFQISDDAVLDDLVSRVLDSKLPLRGKIWVDTSTVHPGTCAKAAEKLAEKGATFVASPVFGTSLVAAAGGLIFSMGGPTDALDRLRPYIVDVMGRRIINMGDDVRTASMLKIAG